jgi:hypothetical protein
MQAMGWQMHWPILHIGLPPLHVAHAAPPVPHWEVDCDPCCTHVSPLQQPVAQEVALHTHVPVAVSHAWPPAHVTHAAPPAPHALADCDPGSTHAPLAVQHPPGHVLALHTQ